MSGGKISALHLGILSFLAAFFADYVMGGGKVQLNEAYAQAYFLKAMFIALGMVALRWAYYKICR